MRFAGFLLILLASCAAPSPDSSRRETLAEKDRAPPVDPTKNEVALPASSGWRASLVVDNGTTGIWTVRAEQIFEQYGCPEVIGLDDAGRCQVLTSYSGKWTPKVMAHDGKWLGGIDHCDVDAGVSGSELYVGGYLGNLYQITASPAGALDCRLIASLPGREIHTIVGGDVDRSHAGPELLLFTRPGALYRATPAAGSAGFEVKLISELPGRIRDAVVLPGNPQEAAVIATVSRAGRLELLRMTASGPQWQTVYQDTMGMGRIAMRPGGVDQDLVLYTTHDDGRVLRHLRRSAREWETETIYLGPQGPRGLAAGRFSADPAIETVAVFGYSRRVQLLSRTGDHWTVETIFEDRDKGHWLAAAELDGRNNTIELLASGYGGRIVLLSRPPGYGQPGVATDSPGLQDP